MKKEKTIKVVLYAVFAIVLTASLGVAASHQGYNAVLTGTEVVPPVETKATGEATFTLSKDGKKLDYALTAKHIENATAAHIHAGKKGENGGPLAGLFAGPKKAGSFSGELAKGTITDKELMGPLAGKKVEDLVKIIKEGGAYVNIHTEKNPNGEVRGQIK